MRGLLWVVASLLLAALAALAAQANDGYLLIVLPPYRIDLSLNLAIFSLVLLYLAIHVVVSMLGAFVRVPRRVAAYREQRVREKGMNLFLDAFLRLFEGRHGEALKKAEQAYARGASPALSALLAARAAQRLRRGEEQQAWLDRASASDVRAEAARGMLEAEMHLDARDFDAAVAAVERLPKSAGRNVAAQRLELRARQGAGQWPEVLRVARQLEKREALATEVLAEAKQRAHLEQIAQLAGDVTGLDQYLKAVPKAEQSVRIVRAVAKALGESGACAEASRVIERELDAHWDDELVGLYAQCAGDAERATARLAVAEKWLQRHPHSARLLLTLGLLCLEQQLWGKAQSYLEASLSIEPRCETHQALARLFDQTDRRDLADRHFRAATGPDACPSARAGGE